MEKKIRRNDNVAKRVHFVLLFQCAGQTGIIERLSTRVTARDRVPIQFPSRISRPLFARLATGIQIILYQPLARWCVFRDISRIFISHCPRARYWIPRNFENSKFSTSQKQRRSNKKKWRTKGARENAIAKPFGKRPFLARLIQLGIGRFFGWAIRSSSV